MNIQGLQKLTLLDYPEKVACTIFTGGCNLRCPFCHNASLVLEDRGNLIPFSSQKTGSISEKEIFQFLNKRKGFLDGVCITGGEPLLQKNICSFMEKVKEIGYQIKLDTNGTMPGRLKELVGSGLVDYVAVDIKNAKAYYGETVGISEFDISGVEQTVAFLMKGKVQYEFRTTVVREFHTEERLRSLGEWIEGASRWRLQQFIDSGDVIRGGLHAWEPKQLKQWAEMLKEYIPDTEARGV